MSVLYVVRHGQASFLADDYDQLSGIGTQQATLLGRYWRDNGVEINEVYSGSLRRHRQTAQATGEAFQQAGRPWPDAHVLEGLNEYDGESVMGVLREELAKQHSEVRQRSAELNAAQGSDERYRAYHRLLECLMQFYVAGDYRSDGIESWQRFHQRVRDAFAVIRCKSGRGRQIAVFTSGGPIGVATQTTLQAPEQQAVELNWRVYNASVTQFTFTRGRVSLDHFNSVTHLPDRQLWTYR